MRCRPAGSLLLLLAACAAEPLPEGLPARVVEPDAASRAELHGIVRTALGGREVVLAPDALTTESLLLIEPAPPRGIDAPPATGRQLGRPERFRLVRDGPQCVLIQDSTGLRWLLLDTRCVPE